MSAALVVIFHPEAGPAAGPLERWVAETRAAIADRHVVGFTAAGADEVRIVAGPPDDTPFGARLRGVLGTDRAGGLVALGSGAVPLITDGERRRLLEVARSRVPRALANSRHSADVVAVSPASTLARLPDEATDNGLPRWLETTQAIRVETLSRWQLGIDVDGPLDILLLARAGASSLAAASVAVMRGEGLVQRVELALGRVAAVAADPRAELLVAGRTSARILAWLERATASRTRALVEERGLRSIAGPSDRSDQRPARSVLGGLLDRDGPEALGTILEELSEAAVVDSRVLMAHRFGADERAWPAAEDRFAADLLRHEDVADPWLRAVTRSAAQARIPVLLGGHTLVGPGLRLALGR